MSLSSAVPQTRKPTDVVLGSAGWVISLAIVLLGNVDVPAGQNGGLVPLLVTGALCTVLAIVLFGVVLPRARALRRTSWILSGLGVLSAIVFWSGITPVFAAAGLAALVGSEAPRRTAMVLAGIATLLSLIALGFTAANSGVL